MMEGHALSWPHIISGRDGARPSILLARNPLLSKCRGDRPVALTYVLIKYERNSSLF